VNVLAIGHIGDLRVAAHAESPRRALLRVSDVDFLASQLRLAEAVLEEFLRNVAVFLADFHIESLGLAMHQTRLGQDLIRRHRQQHQCQPRRPFDHAHYCLPEFVISPSSEATHMLQNIPTHVIGGPLGAGKTSLIKHLLAQKPAHERWAILINEFGQIGLDAALLATAADGISLGEVAGGCLCCVNGAPFQIGLGRLLRKSRPDRLLIEPSGLGHPAQLLKQLGESPWQGVLAVQPSVMVLDSASLAKGQALSISQQEALADAGLLVLNKSAQLSAVDRQRIVGGLPNRPIFWTEQGALPLSELPGVDRQGAVDNSAVEKLVLPKSLAQMPAIWTDLRHPICLSQSQSEGWSIGWRWHPSQCFDLMRTQQWLENQAWRRAKLVIHSPAGWFSANSLEGAAVEWNISEWRKDSRLELIFSEAQDEARLQAQLAACLL
jgi:G3E family GTPase